MPRPSVALANADPAAPGDHLPDGPPVAVQLVSADARLWNELAARAAALRWTQFDSVEDYVARAPAAVVAIVVLDARDLADPGAAIVRLLGHAPAAVPVAYTRASDEAACRRLLRAGTLYELLPEGLPAPALGERLERASEEARARGALLGGAGEEPPAAAAARGANRRTGRFVLIGVALAVLAVAGTNFWRTASSRGDRPVAAAARAAAPARPAATVPAPPTPAPAVALDDLEAELRAARRALRERHYVDPDNDSALSHFQRALAMAPDQPEAREGLARVNAVLLARAETALDAHDLPAAVGALEASRALFAADPRLAALDDTLAQLRQTVSPAQILAAIQADNFDRATTLLQQAESRHQLGAAQLATLRAALASRQGAGEVDSLLRLATARLDQGRLTEPARDSAKAYLAQAEARANPAQQQAVRHLRDAYQRALEAALAAAVARHDEPARLAYARELAARPSPAVAAGHSPERAATDPAAAAVVTPVPAASPEPTPAPAAPAPGAGGAPPRLAGTLSLDYPPTALRRELTGWVDIEVRVGATGSVTGTRVVGSAPARVFDAAAEDAIRHARFLPATDAQGAPVEGRGTIRVRFELPGTRR